MCGIGLIVSGMELEGKSVSVAEEMFGNGSLTADHLMKALQSRGPDCVGRHTITLRGAESEHQVVLRTDGEDKCVNSSIDDEYSQVTLDFVGSSLQLRGALSISQPFRDSHNNVLVYNGEVFGGLPVRVDENDAQVVMNSLYRCCSCICHTRCETREDCVCMEERFPDTHTSIPELLSSIKGPWALIYWQDESKSLWFGRDALGRRSLLVHWPSQEDARLIFSSVAPFLSKKFMKAMMKPSISNGKQTSELSGAEAMDCRKANVDAVPESEIASCVFDYWEELPCGIYSICIGVSTKNQYEDAGRAFYFNNGRLQEHDWKNSVLIKMLAWERCILEPPMDDADANLQKATDIGDTCVASSSVDQLSAGNVLERKLFDEVDNMLEKQEAEDCNIIQNHYFSGGNMFSMEFLRLEREKEISFRVLTALKESVKRRTSLISRHDQGKLEAPLLQRNVELNSETPVAVLFSGGLDSMILAALVDQCLASQCSIDLLNVSFEGESAPDRISALAGMKELHKISPSRRWRLVEVDGSFSDLGKLQGHILSLICPSKTYMDLNIGTALWLAAQGDGWVRDGSLCTRYKSEARVLLVGSGADEQCAGYGRHRTKFKQGGWGALQKEMRLDMQRLWKRNMGRDDRCIADHGKEARFPFLDEDVILTLLDIPLWEIADLRQPSGQGDKKILREIALVLGLKSAASLPKRAIQFGSRIAQESNRRNFGSNRAANQASAGSAILEHLQK